MEGWTDKGGGRNGIKRDGVQEWTRWMECRDGLKEWVGGTDWKAGLDKLNAGIDSRDGLRDGL
jgi:hypothetical protein